MDLAASDSLAPILGELKLNIVLRNLITRLPVTQEITQHDDRMVQTFDYKRANGVIALTQSFRFPVPRDSIFEVCAAARINSQGFQCRQTRFSRSARPQDSIFEVCAAATFNFRSLLGRQTQFSRSPGSQDRFSRSPGSPESIFEAQEFQKDFWCSCSVQNVRFSGKNSGVRNRQVFCTILGHLFFFF